jgi:hypothetical protein
MMELEALGVRDEAAARLTVERFLKSLPGLRENLDWLSKALFEMRGGAPVLRAEPIARRLIRVIDPDSLAALCPELRLAPDDGLDWPAVPLDDGGPIFNLLLGGSCETHIHLGGSLPPCFYWLALMGGELGYETLKWVRSTRRGHADLEQWQSAVSRAAWIRLALAAWAEEAAAARGERRIFGHLPPVEDSAWKPFRDGEPPDFNWPLEVRESILRLNRSLRLRVPGPGEAQDWAFSEPLRRPPRDGMRGHYGEGERRLLAAVGLLLRRPLEPTVRDPSTLHAWFLEYLRTRNAFHGLMVYDHGSDGLQRFAETFSRRGFSYGAGHSHRRARLRRHLVKLERCRMGAALESQLTEPFDGVFRGQREAPRRALEMRVSLPRGPLLLRTFRAWIEGIGDHLRSPKGQTGPNSQIALVIHLIKMGESELHRRQALETARSLGHLLRGYPGLRPFVVGLDAAGDERLAPPRIFAKPFREIQELAKTHRTGVRRPIRLGFTYHVGEDMVDLLTGLRHMDEVASLLLPEGMGGRLGHALALADDPRRFYANRGLQTEPPLGCHLLDLVWAWGRLTLPASHGSEANWLARRILELADKADYDDVVRCYRAMALDRPDAEPLGEHELLEHLKLAGDPSQPLLPPVNEEWFDLLRSLQKILQERFAHRRICIEANPTSNLIIGGFNSYAELPYKALVDAGLPVSINTDDPGLFMTSLPGELAALYDVFAGKMPHRQILTWLADRVFDAEHSTFLGPGTPLEAGAGPREIDELFRYQPD